MNEKKRCMKRSPRNDFCISNIQVCGSGKLRMKITVEVTVRRSYIPPYYLPLLSVCRHLGSLILLNRCVNENDQHFCYFLNNLKTLLLCCPSFVYELKRTTCDSPPGLSSSILKLSTFRRYFPSQRLRSSLIFILFSLNCCYHSEPHC